MIEFIQTFFFFKNNNIKAGKKQNLKRKKGEKRNSRQKSENTASVSTLSEISSVTSTSEYLQKLWVSFGLETSGLSKPKFFLSEIAAQSMLTNQG